MKAHPSNGTPAGIDFAPLGYNESDVNEQAPGRSVDLVRFLLANWRKLAVGFSVGLAAGVAFYYVSGHRYNASTRVLVSKLAGTPLQEGGATTYGDRAEHVQLIKSDVIIRRAFDNANLGELPTLAASDEPIRDLIEDLKVKRTAGQDRSFMNFFDISYESRSKRDAATVVGAIVDAYEQYLLETRKEQSQEVLDLVSEAEVKLQKEIDQLKREYQEFRKASPILFQNPVGTPGSNGSVTLTPPNHYLAAVDQLYKDQRDNRQRRTNVRAQIDVLKAMQEDGESRKAIEQYVLMSMAQRSSGGQGGGASNPLLTVNPAKDRLDAKLLEARIQEANLVHHFGDRHPEVEKLRKTISGILDAYAAEGLRPPAFDRFDGPSGPNEPGPDGVDLAGVYMNYLEEQLRQLDLSDRSIERQLSEAIALAKEHSEYEVIDRQFSTELQRKQALWDGIVSKLSMVDFTKKHTGYRMTRISDILVELSIKRIAKVLGAFGMLGALSVFGLQYFREWQDTTLRSLDELRRLTDTTVMGIVPHFVVDPGDSSRQGGLSDALCYYHNPGSQEAEAYRSVRTTLFFSTAPHNDRVIQVSSPEQGDGKSTSIANLAIAVAQSGKRVLLIDADMRRPTQHQLFAVPQDVGLADVLRREIEWINAVRATPIDGLSLLTAGATPANPAELLSTSDLSTLLHAARSEFDYVFIDAPPLLAVSDPCIISPHVDGMLLVVRMQKNKRPAVVRTRDMLNSHGVELYGVIANDVVISDGAEEEFGAYAAYYNAGPVTETTHGAPSPSQQPVLTSNGDPV